MVLKGALFWLVVFGFVFVTWKLLGLPEGAEIEGLVAGWLATYGLGLVFVGSIIETLLFLGLYFPGSILIFLAVGLSPTPLYAIKALGVVVAGMLIGYTANYWLGKYGWYRLFLKLGMREGLETAQTKLQKNDVRYVAYTFWNPGLASFTATAAGILQMPFRRFLLLCIPATIFWNSLWGLLVYQLGSNALKMIDYRIVLLVLFVWLTFEGFMYLYRRRGGRASVPESADQAHQSTEE